MGIPSYFSHFVRKHRKIIKQIKLLNKPINNLYLDCNAFIYDGVNNDRTNVNEDILNNLIKELEYKEFSMVEEEKLFYPIF